ncbi:hypothetical protein BEWA_027260 [Theileria equi strain WA]|uniref:Uncharacterized protein n=1 Tax=Theileria equi strain WA TaxID=1537102 RepID=L0AWC1_THEEQ|nr:hypothetical protein BEWA_027260 [Theileria equi strain WA]AFZ79877.1 hypothetical protein BEWA_027260 [Theileria equi strain WA]|eukprot:XP_004829543.1 hypothetical protein BEWA_027260 [Theileria equi strain WA]
MNNRWLRLELDKLCGSSECRCKKKLHNLGIATSKVENDPVGGYDKHIHKGENGTFTLKSVRYNGEWIFNIDLENVSGVTEISVYYGGEKRDIPFIIEINNGGKPQHFLNTNPDHSRKYAHTTWEKDKSFFDPSQLSDKLDELSCLSTGSISLDIYRRKLRSYCISSKVGFEGTFFTDETDFYEFKQFTNGQPFRVPYLRYNGKDLPIQMPREDIKEVSTFYWKHNFGKPLIVKVNKQSGETEYHFKDGRSGWTKKRVQDLNSTVLESNCLRNKATTINLSRNNGKYCCTENCKYKRINVITQRNTYPGFIGYEHKAVNDPFTIGKIVNNYGTMQKGIKYPIENVLEVTVYYQTTCPKEPLCMYIKYKVDKDYSEDMWYGRITQNGWSPITSDLGNEDEINKVFRDKFKTVSRVLTTSCRIEDLPEDTTVLFPKDMRDKPLDSPENTLNKLVNEANENDIGFFKPKGPEDDERKPIGQGSQIPNRLYQLRKTPKPIPLTPNKIIPMVNKVVEEVKQEIEAQKIQDTREVSESVVKTAASYARYGSGLVTIAGMHTVKTVIGLAEDTLKLAANILATATVNSVVGSPGEQAGLTGSRTVPGKGDVGTEGVSKTDKEAKVYGRTLLTASEPEDAQSRILKVSDRDVQETEKDVSASSGPPVVPGLLAGGLSSTIFRGALVKEGGRRTMRTVAVPIRRSVSPRTPSAVETPGFTNANSTRGDLGEQYSDPTAPSFSSDITNNQDNSHQDGPEVGFASGLTGNESADSATSPDPLLPADTTSTNGASKETPLPNPAPNCNTSPFTEILAGSSVLAGYAFSGTIAGAAATFFGGWRLYKHTYLSTIDTD